MMFKSEGVSSTVSEILDVGLELEELRYVHPRSFVAVLFLAGVIADVCPGKRLST